MRWMILLCLCSGWFACCGCKTQSAKISKVLPHYLDLKGQHTVAPSLYERDAYQAHLRANPDEVSGLRFDVRWTSTVYYVEGLRLRLELRGSKAPQAILLERDIEERRWYQRWTSFELDDETFRQLGDIVAWRATLWDGDRLLADHESFLW